MYNRIRELRETLKLSRRKFGERIKLSGDVINNIERNRVEIKDYIVKLIINEYNVNENWLRTGEGDMFDEFPHSEIEALKEKYDLSPLETVIIEKYVGLPAEKRKAAENFLDELLQEMNLD